jgi:hypothetical protein
MAENESEHDASDSDKEPLSAGAPDSKAKPHEGREARQQRQSRSNHQGARRRVWLERRISIIVEVLTLASLLAYTFFSYRMWKSMEISNATSQVVAEANARLVDSTIKGMEESTREANAALGESKRLNRIAGRGVDEAARHAESAAKLAEVTAQEAEESKVRGEAQRKLAEDNLALNKQAFQHGAGARIEITNFGRLDLAEAPEWTTIAVRNAGAATANVTVEASFKLEPPALHHVDAVGASPSFQFGPRALRDTRFIPPNQSIEFEVYREEIPKDVVSALKSGRMLLRLVGIARDTDDIGQVHGTRICAQAEPEVTAVVFKSKHRLLPCPDNNAPETESRK